MKAFKSDRRHPYTLSYSLPSTAAPLALSIVRIVRDDYPIGR
jgi:hypothetical protein